MCMMCSEKRVVEVHSMTRSGAALIDAAQHFSAFVPGSGAGPPVFSCLQIAAKGKALSCGNSVGFGLP